jgi:hypothetical protein
MKWEIDLSERDDEATIAMERQVWRHNAQISHNLAKKIDAVFLANENPVNVCLATIYHRCLSAMHTLLVLHESGHDYTYDAAVILRGLYDAHLQGLYILQEPPSRARDFLEYLWIQTKDMVDWIEKSDSRLADSLRSNPLYSASAPNVDVHYARVRAKFLTRKGDRCRDNWYKGKLADLAKSVDYFTEYELMQPKLSGSVHSTPYAMIHGPGLPKSGFVNFGWMFLFRILGRIAEHLNVPLDEYERESVRLARHSIAEYPGA